MRTLLSTLALLMGFGSIATAQDALPERLPAAESRAGWIKLFDNATMFGWKASGAGDWNVVDGVLQSPDTGENTLATTSQFGDFELQITLDGDKGLHYFLSDGYNDDDGALKLTNKDLAMWGPLDAKPKFHVLTVRAVGTQMQATLDGKPPTRKYRRPNPRSAIVFRVEHPNGLTGTLRIADVKLRPLDLPAAFNGRDLTGWKPLPGHASVFAVTPEGWLNIKNGNGDLETEQAYSDFTLQTDVFSNGNHLNSGIFFREKPGEFWNGYECQIRNQWEGSDRTKPVDTGTGGLYFRQPARKVVASDREWFTMTINAVGRHIAIWTNGYQTADFQDTRKAGDGMARDNFRKSGVIGLQGHDPTTDLSFRAIRIGELPPVKP